ncbi:unnamed protein product [Thlaspi arvense]|uniref:Uncharacterized protein n=1 Tax=Thlaspi arvense TaxID=13288 RepID=A0AAU9S0T9_THLAR|nr:unnamed protein product [Thlaspi arvense]
MDITLSKLKYAMGKEPVNGFKAIDKYSDFKYIAKVKEILGPEQFKRIEDSFLGPVFEGYVSNIQSTKAQHMDVLLNHHWGKDAYEMLLKSVKKTVEKNLEKSKYPLDGFPFALHLWILESVPKLQSAFSTIDKTMDVVHILPKIHGDVEDTVFLQDKCDEDLHSLVDLLEKGFRLTHDHWKTKIVKRDDALPYIASQSYRYPHSERARQNSRPPSSDESVEAKLDQLKKIFIDGQRHIRSRLSKIEQKFGIYDLSDSIDEDISDHVSPPVHHETGVNPIEVGPSRKKTVNRSGVVETTKETDKMNDDETTTSSKEQEEAQTQMEKDERTNQWRSNKLLAILVQTPPVISTSMETVGGNEPAEMDNDDGSQENNETTPALGPIRSYYLRYLSIDKYENVQEMRIRPTLPQVLYEEHVANVLEAGQVVEVYHNEHWCRGCVEAPIEGTKVSIHLYYIDKTQLVDVMDTRIFRQWVDEAWDPPVDVAIQEDAVTSASPTTVEDIAKPVFLSKVKPEMEKVEKVKSKEEKVEKAKSKEEKGKKEKSKKKKAKKEQNEELEKTSLRKSKWFKQTDM